MNENGCGFRAFIRQSFEAARLPFHVGVEALSADLRMSLVARGHGIGIVTPAAFAGSPHRESIEIIDSADFRPAGAGVDAASTAVPGGSPAPSRFSAKRLSKRWKMPAPFSS